MLTVVVLRVGGGKFRLYYRSSPSVKPVVCGPHLGRGNPLPLVEFIDYEDEGKAIKDARRLQAYINREHKSRYVE